MGPKIPTSIVHLFQTNCVPSPEDTRLIHQLLEEQNLELSVVNEGLERARAEISCLEAKHNEIMEIVQQLEALRSPIRRMPIDIMAKIFDHCLEDDQIPKLDPLRAPMLLGQVCSAWKELVFSLPCLWRNLKVEFPTETKNWEIVMQSKIMSMHVWISRTKALPISLILEHSKGFTIPWATLMSLDKEILTLGCRIQELSLKFSPLALSSLLTCTQGPLPHLRHLELLSTNVLPGNDNPPPLFLHDAPSLASLSIAWGSLDTTQFVVPWSQLTQLSLQYDANPFWNPVHDDYLVALRQCPNLTSCSLGIGATIIDIDPDMVNVPVILPKLESMRVRLFCHTRYLHHFFDELHTPTLRTFEIQNVSLALGSFTGQTESLPFIVRSADTLENLCLDRMDISDTDILSCLSRLHRITHLRILPGPPRLNHHLVDNFILSGASQGSSICPLLKSLSLKCTSGVSIDGVVELVESRCSGSFKLKDFRLLIVAFGYGGEKRDEKIGELQERLKQFVDGGLELHLVKAMSVG